MKGVGVNKMKKSIYIGLFILLGILVQFFIHIVVEILYINLLINNFALFGLGLSWNAWFVIHIIWGIVLLVLGISTIKRNAVAFNWQGVYWWKRIYEKAK